MPAERSMRDVLRNLLQNGDLPFRDFIEIALYHPELGYYTRAKSPVGKEGDFITGPSLSPAFAFAIGKLCREFVRGNTDGVSTIVDVGSGSGELVRALQGVENAEIYGIDRAVTPSVSEGPGGVGGAPTRPPRPLAQARGDRNRRGACSHRPRALTSRLRRTFSPPAGRRTDRRRYCKYFSDSLAVSASLPFGS